MKGATLMEVENISNLLSAATPLVAIGVTVWVSSRASRSQKRFDRETDLMTKVLRSVPTMLL